MEKTLKQFHALNENKDERPVYLSVWVDNKILPGGVHNSKEAGMKHMVYGDGPDGHHLVKTTTKVLGKKREGQFVPRSVGKHLDNQPFPHDDGPHYSVHKESIDEDHCMVCKDCGDEQGKPTKGNGCKNDCNDPNGSHWMKGKPLEEAFSPHMMFDPQTGKGRMVNDKSTHLRLKGKGWGHENSADIVSENLDELSVQIFPKKSKRAKEQAMKMSKLSDELAKKRKALADHKPGEPFSTNEEFDDEEVDESWTPQMRRAAARRMRIIAPKIKLGIKRSKNRTATREKLMNRSVRSVKSALIKKFTKGMSKSELTPARKAEMEKRISKLGPRIKQLAMKQLPMTRKLEAERKKSRMNK